MAEEKMKGFSPAVWEPGFEMAEQAVRLTGCGAGSSVIDVGCGSGETLRFLRDARGMTVFGIDRDQQAVAAAGENLSKDELAVADAAAIPSPDHAFDLALCECSFSLFPDPAAALLEIRRVLKKGGTLAVSDLYARRRETEWAVNEKFRFFYAKETVRRLIEAAGFHLSVFRDCSDWLSGMVGQMLFDGKKEDFEDCFGVGLRDFKQIGCGYFLMIARRAAE